MLAAQAQGLAAHIRVDFQAQLVLQGLLAGSLPAEVIGRVISNGVLVRLRVPFVQVDAIGDAVEYVLPRLQHLVQSPTALRCRDLPRIALRMQASLDGHLSNPLSTLDLECMCATAAHHRLQQNESTFQCFAADDAEVGQTKRNSQQNLSV